MNILTIIFIFATILLETAHQLFLKLASLKPEKYLLYCFSGILMYIFELVVWFKLLQKLPLGFALPIMGINFVVVAFAGKLFFNEEINLKRFLGIILILTGFVIVWLGGAEYL